MIKFYKNFLIAAGLFTALTAGAIGPEAGELTLSVSPKYPAAGESFTVKAKSFTFDILRSNIQWVVNGKLTASGSGLSEQTFTAPKIGSSMTITVIATQSGGASFQKQIIVSVSDIDLIVKPLTYTPLFYRGSSFASPGSTVEIYAHPHLYSGGSKISPKNLIYEWYVGDSKAGSQSGQGRNKLILNTADAGNVSYDVRLIVSSAGGSVSSQKNIRIKSQNPEVLFYETNSLTGRGRFANNIFNLAAGNNMSIIAEPYFFNIPSLGRAVITWSTNNSAIENTADNPRILEVAAPQESFSSTNFGFSMEDKKTIYQRATAELTINATE